MENDLCRLCLVTPPRVAPEAFAPILDDALRGGDVASLIVTADPDDLSGLAEIVVPIAQTHGVAVLIHNDIAIALRTGADGVHIDDGGVDLSARISSLRPEKIVGIGDLKSRHEAMTAGDDNPDYVFFGRLDGDTDATIFKKAQVLAAWWAGLFQIPAVLMGGTSLSSVQQALLSGVEFVALRRAVWEHPAGGSAAVAEANRIIMTAAREAVP